MPKVNFFLEPVSSSICQIFSNTTQKTQALEVNDWPGTTALPNAL